MQQSITTSLQEMGANYANTTLSSLNDAVVDIIGVDVLWFRAKPDKANQDVIFQNYTLYGVEDCPLKIKAIYSDNNYDDAAITFQIMGLSYAVPLSLELSLNRWKEATGNDGTIPQEKDIVFIPISRKLMQVTSMTPVKKLGAQLTSWKVNLSIYTPTRSRIVGENLKESIINTTTNLDERFGKEIKETIADIIDDNQLSLYTSTNVDKNKEIPPTVTEESGMFDIRTIVMEDLIVDGHTFARNFYDLSKANGIAVKYKKTDSFTRSDSRCLSCWVCPIDSNQESVIRNIKGDVTIDLIDGDKDFAYINTSIGSKFKVGDNVVFKRGKIILPGKVVDKDRIQVNRQQVKKLSRTNEKWYEMTGFVVTFDNMINLMSSENFEININDRNVISIRTNTSSVVITLENELTPYSWYGIYINLLGDTFGIDIYKSNGKLERIESRRDIKNLIYDSVNCGDLFINGSSSYLTNIRFYNVSNIDIDKQILDLVSYNARNDSHAIVNDSADTYINKPYLGKQR